MLHLYVIAISGQETCLTVSSRPPQWIFNQSLRSSTSTSYRLNIFIHIVRSSKGKGLSAGIASSIINTLNNSFTNTNIQFVLHGTDFIDSDYYYNNLTDKENQLFTVNAHENAIDIYVLGTSTTWIGSGLANGIPSTALIIHGKHYNTSTLPHEMGHCLGLYHTHHGTIYEEGSDDTNQCAEFVDGSNSSICGDYISDTPADPNRWSNNSCSYIGTGVDGHGDSYTPNASNYMSYAHKPCRTLFSDLQIDRMKLFINNTPSLQQVIDYNISGPSFVCDQATYTIQNLLPGAIVQWSVNNNNLQLLSGQGTGMATFKKSNIGRTNITAEIYNNNILISGVNQLVSVGVPELYTYGDYLYSGGQPKRCFVENQANSCYLQSDQDENIDKWDWRVTSGEIFVSGLKNENATIYPRPSSPPSFMIEIRALNPDYAIEQKNNYNHLINKT
ncbi:M43 family zinc metalloprotease [Tannerella forsythia]|uniref:Peptidase M43 pregnancy-associated plasma-A domain-containing protein n=1 Tax=Tannerella forsythia TaxID=28112 RepID=A0A3P1XCK5_TANFO|nr:M43 family zinc metalloprotease [Tannerella forsythia]RRD56135.1 hypothetical protein EII40_13980 [Tannerella forsythia]